MKKILSIAWKILYWLLVLTPILIGARCTQMGVSAVFIEPTEDELRASCSYSIQQGDYSSFAENLRMDACLEDTYMSLGGAVPVGIMMATIGMLLLFFGVRKLWVIRRKSKIAAGQP
jgi:hypothetical protein